MRLKTRAYGSSFVMPGGAMHERYCLNLHRKIKHGKQKKNIESLPFHFQLLTGMVMVWPFEQGICS